MLQFFFKILLTICNFYLYIYSFFLFVLNDLKKLTFKPSISTKATYAVPGEMNYFAFEQITILGLYNFNEKIIINENKLKNIKTSINLFLTLWMKNSYDSLDFRYFNIPYNYEKIEANMPCFDIDCSKKDLIFCLFFMWIYNNQLQNDIELLLRYEI